MKRRKYEYCILYLLIFAFQSMASEDIVGGDNGSIEKCGESKIDELTTGVNKGDLESSFKLGVHKYLGKCVNKNEQEAFWLFVVAAQGGVVDAYYNVALMYHMGVGVDQDIDRAVKMIKVLVKKGYKPAENYIKFLKERKGISMRSDTIDMIDKNN